MSTYGETLVNSLSAGSVLPVASSSTRSPERELAKRVHELARIYRKMSAADQRLFRSLIVDAAWDKGNDSRIGVFSSSAAETPRFLTRLWEHSLSAASDFAAYADDWNLKESAIPAYVPKAWLAELKSWNPDDASTADFDWES